MKKYVSCFLFFFALTSASLITLFFMTAGEKAQRVEEVQMQESGEDGAFYSYASGRVPGKRTGTADGRDLVPYDG